MSASAKECPVCFEIYRGQIFLCEKGHTLCQPCSQRIDTCPRCRAPMTRNRCFDMESLVKELKSAAQTGPEKFKMQNQASGSKNAPNHHHYRKPVQNLSETHTNLTGKPHMQRLQSDNPKPNYHNNPKPNFHNNPKPHFHNNPKPSFYNNPKPAEEVPPIIAMVDHLVGAFKAGVAAYTGQPSTAPSGADNQSAYHQRTPNKQSGYNPRATNSASNKQGGSRPKAAHEKHSGTRPKTVVHTVNVNTSGTEWVVVNVNTPNQHNKGKGKKK